MFFHHSDSSECIRCLDLMRVFEGSMMKGIFLKDEIHVSVLFYRASTQSVQRVALMWPNACKKTKLFVYTCFLENLGTGDKVVQFKQLKPPDLFLELSSFFKNSTDVSTNYTYLASVPISGSSYTHTHSQHFHTSTAMCQKHEVFFNT